MSLCSYHVTAAWSPPAWKGRGQWREPVTCLCLLRPLWPSLILSSLSSQLSWEEGRTGRGGSVSHGEEYPPFSQFAAILLSFLQPQQQRLIKYIRERKTHISLSQKKRNISCLYIFIEKKEGRRKKRRRKEEKNRQPQNREGRKTMPHHHVHALDILQKENPPQWLLSQLCLSLAAHLSQKEGEGQGGRGQGQGEAGNISVLSLCGSSVSVSSGRRGRRRRRKEREGRKRKEAYVWRKELKELLLCDSSSHGRREGEEKWLWHLVSPHLSHGLSNILLWKKKKEENILSFSPNVVARYSWEGRKEEKRRTKHHVSLLIILCEEKRKKNSLYLSCKWKTGWAWHLYSLIMASERGRRGRKILTPLPLTYVRPLGPSPSPLHAHHLAREELLSSCILSTVLSSLLKTMSSHLVSLLSVCVSYISSLMRGGRRRKEEGKLRLRKNHLSSLWEEEKEKEKKKKEKRHNKRVSLCLVLCVSRIHSLVILSHVSYLICGISSPILLWPSSLSQQLLYEGITFSHERGREPNSGGGVVFSSHLSSVPSMCVWKEEEGWEETIVLNACFWGREIHSFLI